MADGFESSYVAGAIASRGGSDGALEDGSEAIEDNGGVPVVGAAGDSGGWGGTSEDKEGATEDK